MGLQLPGELVSLLGMLGYTWPEADESKLFRLGSQWMGFSGALNEIAATAGAQDAAEARRFVAWVQAPAAQAVLARYGFLKP